MEHEQSAVLSDCFCESTEHESLIRRVLLCGNSSGNGYAIPASAFVNESYAKGLYEGKPVFIDHPVFDERGPRRSARDIAGVISSVYFESGKPYGDIQTQGFPSGSLLRDLVKLKGVHLGMSHVAQYEWDHPIRKSKITKIRQVASVDAVVSPATTKTFYENQGVKGMELDTLTAELQSVRAERDLHKESLGKANARVTELEQSLKAVTTERDGLSLESKNQAAKIEKFELESTLANRRKAIAESLEKEGLDLKDKAVVSDLWFESLMSEADETKRGNLIKDRVTFVTEARKPSAGGAQGSGERKTPEGPKRKSNADLWAELNAAK